MQHVQPTCILDCHVAHVQVLRLTQEVEFGLQAERTQQ